MARLSVGATELGVDDFRLLCQHWQNLIGGKFTSEARVLDVPFGLKLIAFVS